MRGGQKQGQSDRQQAKRMEDRRGRTGWRWDAEGGRQGREDRIGKAGGGM